MIERIPALSAAAAIPDSSTLVARLRQALGASDVVITSRDRSGSGTFPKETVRYRLPNGSTGAVFCKYAAPRDTAFGHRGGVGFEAAVYEQLLSGVSITVPRLVAHGASSDGTEWLMIEFLEDALRLSERDDMMVAAATWLGRFQAVMADATPRAALLPRYTETYFQGWADRTVEFAASRPEPTLWLVPLREHYLDLIPHLVGAQPTIIHGEFTVHNVMVARGAVYPTDWETAAMAAGEIDLMCLVDAWPEDVVSACVAAYRTARWPAGPPVGEAERLRAAELYLHFRWLGENPELMLIKKRIWRFDRLRQLSAELE